MVIVQDQPSAPVIRPPYRHSCPPHRHSGLGPESTHKASDVKFPSREGWQVKPDGVGQACKTEAGRPPSNNHD